MAYIPNPEAFKHYAYGKYKVDFYKQTAIIKWTDKVGDNYDEKTSYKAQKQAISDTLRNNMMFDTEFILLQEISPAAYTQLPPEKEVLELYVNFKIKDLKAKDKKDEIRRFLDNM
jgi:hypothetical protein